MDGKVHEANWRVFKAEYKFTIAFMMTLKREVGENFMQSKMVKGRKNRALLEHTTRAFFNFIKKKKIVSSEGDTHFNLVALEPLKI